MLDKNTDSQVHTDKIEQPPKGLSIAFGLERIGLIAVKAPILSCMILLVLIVGAIFGIQRIKIDDSLSQLFRSNSKDYKQYEAETKRFPATEFDVLVVVEGKTLLARDNLEKLRDLVTDLQLVDGTRGLISLFSARQAPAPGKLPAALFPNELPQGADYDKFIETVKSNEIIRGKLLSEDGTLALIVLSLEPDVVASSKLGKTVGDIRKLMADDLKGSGLKAELSGVPVMQLEIRNAVERDGLTYNILGILAGCIIAIIFFRKWSFMVVAAFPPMIAILLALGGARLGQFQSQHVPQRDDAADHGDQLLGLDAADLRGARPADRGPGQIHRVQERGAGGRAGLRADPRHRRHLVHRPAILRFRPDPQIRRGGLGRHHHRADRGALAGAGVRRAAGAQRKAVRGEIPDRRRRRPGAAQFLLLDRGAHGQPPGHVQPDRGGPGGGAWDRLRQFAAALPACRPGSGQAAGGGGQRPARRQADRRQSDRRADRIPQGRDALFAGNPADDRRSSRDRRNRGRRRQCLVAGDAAALARRKGRQYRRRDPEGICQRDPEISGAALHLGRSEGGGGVGPGAGSRFQPDPAGGREARRRARRRSAPSIRATRSRSPACPPSPRATAPA